MSAMRKVWTAGVIAGLTALFISAQVTADDLIKNGGFEKGETSSEGWEYMSYSGGEKYNPGKFKIMLDTREKHGGGKSLKITGSEIQDAGKPLCFGGIISVSFILEPKTEYTFSFWYKTKDLKKVQGVLPGYLHFNGGNVDKEWKDRWLEDTGGEWAKIQGIVHHLTEETQQVTLILRNFGEGDIWFDDVNLVKGGEVETAEVGGKTYAIIRHKEDHPAAALTPGDEKKGYVIFARDNPAGVYPDSYPAEGEIIQSIKTFAAHGEYEPVTFTIYPLKDLKNVKVEITDLINEKGEKFGKDNIDVRSVKCWIQAVERGYQVEPELLEKAVPLNLKEKVSQQYWLTFYIPEKTPPGKYEGKIIVSPGNTAGTQIGLGLRVLPFTLTEETPYKFGCWNGIAMRSRYNWDEVRLRLKDMKEHGMNCMVYNYPESTYDYDEMTRLSKDEIKLDFSKDNMVVKLYQEAGFEGPVILELTRLTNAIAGFLGLEYPSAYYRDGNKGSTLQMPEDKAPPEFVEAFKECIRQIYQNAKENKWPPVYLHINDEPCYQGTEVIKAAGAQYRWAKEAVPDAKTFCPSKATTDSQREALNKYLLPYVDIQDDWVRDEGEKQYVEKQIKDGLFKEMWGCTGPGNVETNAYTRNRLYSGFKFKKTGMTGIAYWYYGTQHAEWRGGDIVFPEGYTPMPWDIEQKERDMLYENPSAKNGDWNPYADIPDKDVAISYRSPKDGSVVPTLGWEGVREGLDDLRYILTLEGLIEKGKNSKDPEVREMTLQAEQTLKSIINAVPWKVASIDWWETVVSGDTIPNSAMNQYRWQVSQHIMKLTEGLKE